MSLKILIIEGHEIYRDGLQYLIRGMFDQVEILEAADYSSAVENLVTHKDICLVFLDIKIPSVQGVGGLHELRRLFPSPTIIVVSSIDSSDGANQIVSIGANGFISKTTPKDQMINAIYGILSGDSVIVSEHEPVEMIELSKRQNDTLLLLEKGKSNKDIANELGVSYATAREHVSKLLNKLDAKNRTQVVQIAKKMGLIFEI